MDNTDESGVAADADTADVAVAAAVVAVERHIQQVAIEVIEWHTGVEVKHIEVLRLELVKIPVLAARPYHQPLDSRTMQILLVAEPTIVPEMIVARPMMLPTMAECNESMDMHRLVYATDF